MITPPRPQLRRQWTSDKIYAMKVHANAKNAAIGKALFNQIIHTCNPKTALEVIAETELRWQNSGFAHYLPGSGHRLEHRSRVEMHNGVLKEKREYFNPHRIVWLPIYI